MAQPRPVHPGEILREDFLPEYSLTAGSLAKALLVPRDRIEKIIRESRALTADTAARLARYFGTTPQFWLNLQANYDLGFVNAQEISAIAPTVDDPFTTFAEWNSAADEEAYGGN